MRQVYRLLGLVRRYGPGPVDTACERALDLDVVNVTKIASMLEKATENTPLPARPASPATARFARDQLSWIEIWIPVKFAAWLSAVFRARDRVGFRRKLRGSRVGVRRRAATSRAGKYDNNEDHDKK